MSDIAIRFGLAVRRNREAVALSQEALAELAGLNRAYLGEVERGSAAPTITTMEKIAHALNQDLSDLLIECENDD